MKLLRITFFILFAAALAAAWIGWRKATHAAGVIASLREQLDWQKEQQDAANEAQAETRERELQRLRAEAAEVVRLRGEISQLRAGAKDAETVRADNQRLRTLAEQSRAAAASAPAPAAAPADQFPRESWKFSGYATPEDSLISAVWAMKEGTPKTYFETLSTEEQARTTKLWEGKSEAEIAAKYQGDVARITAVRVLGREEISPDEIQMRVYVGGVDRLEKMSLKRVGAEWKFNGLIRPPPQ